MMAGYLQLYLHRQNYKKQIFLNFLLKLYFYSKTNEMHQVLKFILFCSNTLHVSDGLSVRHQESKTVHTTPGICQILLAAC